MLGCTRCAAPLPLEAALQEADCPGCGARVAVAAFPSLFTPLRPGEPGSPVVAQEAGCFDHPQRHAVVPCDHCGRFVCAQCDLPISGRHYCHRCLETLEQPGSNRLVGERLRYDGIALSLAVLPLLIFYLTILTAPAVLFLVVWFWRRPLSVLPYGRWRFLVAAMLALLEIGGWIAIAIVIAVDLARRP